MHGFGSHFSPVLWDVGESSWFVVSRFLIVCAFQDASNQSLVFAKVTYNSADVIYIYTYVCLCIYLIYIGTRICNFTHTHTILHKHNDMHVVPKDV